MGDATVLVTTKGHLLHVSCDRHPKVDIVTSLTHRLAKNPQGAQVSEERDQPEVPVVVKALADRVIFAS